MKRIVVLESSDDIYNMRREIIEEMIHNGYEVTIILPYGPKVEYFKEIGCKYIDVDIDRRGTNPISDMKLLLTYLRILKKINPDFVLTFTTKPNVYGGIASRLCNVKYITNISGLGSTFLNKNLTQLIVKSLYSCALKNAHLVFFQNKNNLELILQNQIYNGAYKLIPGSGVNLDRFSEQPYPTDNVNIKFNYIGRVMHEKGIDDYINAAQIIKSRYTNVQFNIIGGIENENSKYIETLKKLEDKDIITYHGKQFDVIPFITSSHCTIHPSKYGEGMSNVLLESAASARPIITTNISGCKETVEHNSTGYIYYPGDVGDLVNKIEDFLLLSIDEKRNLGVAGRKRVENGFSRELVVKAYLDELNL